MLPSQTARVSSSRTPMFRKRRRSPRPLLFVGGAVVVLIGIWWLAGSAGSDGVDALLDQPLSKTSSEPAPSPAPASAPEFAAPEASYPPPTLITLGTRANDSPAAQAAAEETKPIEPVAFQPKPEVQVPTKSEPASERVAEAPPPSPPPAAAERPEFSTPAASPALDPRPTSPAHSAPAPPAAEPTIDPGLPADLHALISLGRQKVAAEPVIARQLLTKALIDARTSDGERARLRDELARLNDELVFSPRAIQGDPFVAVYAVQSGDALEKIARKNGLATHWRLIQRVNRLANPNRIQLNQKLKLVKGPFHAVVIKSAYRMDLYMGDPAKPHEWVFVRSLRVGLGEGNSTPTGDFVVRRGSKLENPHWVNPRTGEQFSKDDPKNPIGERWIGLEGLGQSAASTGYGIHGTIDPDSIGQQRSMGCVRLGEGDVELVYDLLGEGVSAVRIVP